MPATIDAQEQLEKIAGIDRSIARLEKKNGENEAVIAELHGIDSTLSTQIEALQVRSHSLQTRGAQRRTEVEVFITTQHTAAEDAAKLDDLEVQCTDLSSQLQESEVSPPLDD